MARRPPSARAPARTSTRAHKHLWPDRSIFRTRRSSFRHPPAGRPSSSCPSSIMTKLPDLEASSSNPPGAEAVWQLVALEGGAAVSSARKGVTRDAMRSGSGPSPRDSEEVQSSNDSKMRLEDIINRAANFRKTSLGRRSKFACWAVAIFTIAAAITTVIYFLYRMDAQITAQSDQIVKMKAQMAAQSDQIVNQIPHKHKPDSTEQPDCPTGSPPPAKESQKCSTRQ